MNGKTFAEAMDIDASSLSRWENGEKRLGNSTEKLLRHNVAARLHKAVQGMHYEPEDIAQMKFVDLKQGVELPPLAASRVHLEDKSQLTENEEEHALWAALPIAA